jgi:hypothetical protein
MSVWMRTASMTWEPMVKTGLRLVMGSWNIMEASLPLMSRMAVSERERMSLPARVMVPETMRPGGLGMRRRDGEGGDRLAAAGFADEAEGAAGGEREGDAVDGAGDAVVGEEVGAKVVDGEDVGGRVGGCGRVGHCRHGVLLFVSIVIVVV